MTIHAADLSPMTDVLSALKNGDLILVHDPDREEEADLMVLAEGVTAETVNTLLTRGKGLICVACSGAVCDRLQLPLMVQVNENLHGTNFTLSVDAREGITTGVSAPDRALTMRRLAAGDASPRDFVRPGHTFPLRAMPLTERFGHTECAVALAEMCGGQPVVVICEVLDDQGEKASWPQVQALAAELGCPITDMGACRAAIASHYKVDVC